MKNEDMIYDYWYYMEHFSKVKEEIEKYIIKVAYSIGFCYKIPIDPEFYIFKEEKFSGRLINHNGKWKKNVLSYGFDKAGKIIEYKEPSFSRDLYLYVFFIWYDYYVKAITYDLYGILINIKYYFFDDNNIINLFYSVQKDGCEKICFNKNIYEYNDTRLINKIIKYEYNEEGECGISEEIFKYNSIGKIIEINKNTKSVLGINKGLIL